MGINAENTANKSFVDIVGHSNTKQYQWIN